MKNNYGKINKNIKITFLKDPKPEVARSERVKLNKEIKELKAILSDLKGYEEYLHKNESSGRYMSGNALIWKLTKEGKCKTLKRECIERNYKPSRGGGVIIQKTCECGKYSPKSTRGVIDTSCKNCGGMQKQVRIR